MSEAPAQLQYAPKPPLGQRRGIRWLVIGVILLPLVPLMYKLVLRGIPRVVADHTYSQCLSYSPPSLAYSNDPSDATSLSSHAEYVTGPLGPNTVTLLLPQIWRDLHRQLWNAPATDSALFLHERQSASGAKRLVFVGLQRLVPETFSTHAEFKLRTLSRGSILSFPQSASMNVLNMRIAYGHGTVRFSSGQTDPADASHFTIAYTVDGQPGILDGWLRDDDSILLEPRDAAAPTTGATTVPVPPLPGKSP